MRKSITKEELMQAMLDLIKRELGDDIYRVNEVGEAIFKNNSQFQLMTNPDAAKALDVYYRLESGELTVKQFLKKFEQDFLMEDIRQSRLKELRGEAS